jgi:Holliday junction resolvasome RuvABC endonuclease subunit
VDKKKVIICAIDPSISSTGIAIIEYTQDLGFKLLDKCTLLNKKALPDRWKKKEITFELFEYYLKDKIQNIDFFVIENYSYGSVGYLSDAGEMVGLFKHYIWQHKVAFDVIAPSTVKRIIGGSGLAKKEEVASKIPSFLINKEKIIFNNFDETDAVAIGVAYILDLEAKENDNKREQSDIDRPTKNKKRNTKDRSSTKKRASKR